MGTHKTMTLREAIEAIARNPLDALSRDLLRFTLSAQPNDLSTFGIVLDVLADKADAFHRKAVDDAFNNVIKARRDKADATTAAQRASRAANLEKARAKRWAKGKPAKRKRRATTKHEGNTGKVWEALQQSSGNLTSNDIAGVLELPLLRVQAALYALAKSHPSSLQRKWHKAKRDDGSTQGEYLYTYVGKAKPAPNGVA